jgi:hypothetical protein
MQRTLRTGILTLALATLLTPLAAAHVGAGVDVHQHFLVCNLGQDRSTDDLPLSPGNPTVVVEQDCSTVHAEYEATNVNAQCASIDFVALLPPLGLLVDQLETLPDNPQPWGPGAPAPHGCWLQAAVTLP